MLRNKGRISNGNDLPPLSAANTLDKNNLKDITARSYEDSINANEQQTKSCLMADTKESEEAGMLSLMSLLNLIKPLILQLIH